MVRVNSLILREISLIIHTEFQMETVAITITEVKIMPDLRTGKVFYSVLGDELAIKQARKFFRKFSGRIKFILGNRVVLKYTPNITFHYDDSMEKGADLIKYMDEIDQKNSPQENHE